MCEITRYTTFCGMLALAMSLPALAQLGSEVNVHLPPTVWEKNTDRAVPCQRCCIYENRSYSEGAIINAQNILLQCQQEPHTAGTRSLIWQRVVR